MHVIRIAMAYISFERDNIVGVKPSPTVISFSVRDPNINEESILKVCFSQSRFFV